MDSPRSWLVAVGCCWVNVFTFCMIRSAAVVYVSIIETFQTTREEASWPVTLAATCYFSAALIAGILARHVVVWKITFTACLVAAIAVSLCFFATGVTYLALVYGVVYGLSVGQLSLSSTVINQHFTKYRAVASGLNMAGFSVGGLIFPPTVQFFFDEFGFRGAFLLAGGTILNGTAGTLLQRIPAPKQAPQPAQESAEVTKQNIQDSDTTEAARVLSETTSTLRCQNEESAITKHNMKSGVKNAGFEPSEPADGSTPTENVHVVECSTRCLSVKENIICGRDSPKTKRRANLPVDAEAPIRNILREDYVTHNEDTCQKGAPFPLPVHKAKLTLSAEQSSSKLSVTAAEVHPTEAAQRTSGGVKSALLAAKELFSFLALAKYYVVVLSKAVIVTNGMTFSTVIIDLAMDHGINRWRALTLISAYTGMDLMARLTSGWITDRKFLSRNALMAFCMSVWTAANFYFAFGDSYLVLVIVSCVAGWCNGSTLPLVPVLYMEVVDIGRFSVAYGLSSFLVGLTGLPRPSLTGYFRDKLGSYSGLFLLTGTCSALSAMRWTYVTVREKCCRNRQKE
ncbi:monocarboxylate transporter 12-like [Dermacentor variabilis]|uniref:monocarboxylate transporter 12-like n=1 Tax=Dermacentor variabilis TaxID=34621 RepID=UPI003F5BC0A1